MENQAIADVIESGFLRLDLLVVQKGGSAFVCSHRISRLSRGAITSCGYIDRRW